MSLCHRSEGTVGKKCKYTTNLSGKTDTWYFVTDIEFSPATYDALNFERQQRLPFESCSHAAKRPPSKLQVVVSLKLSVPSEKGLRPENGGTRTATELTGDACDGRVGFTMLQNFLRLLTRGGVHCTISK